MSDSSGEILTEENPKSEESTTDVSEEIEKINSENSSVITVSSSFDSSHSSDEKEELLESEKEKENSNERFSSDNEINIHSQSDDEKLKVVKSDPDDSSLTSNTSEDSLTETLDSDTTDSIDLNSTDENKSSEDLSSLLESETNIGENTYGSTSDELDMWLESSNPTKSEPFLQESEIVSSTASNMQSSQFQEREKKVDSKHSRKYHFFLSILVISLVLIITLLIVLLLSFYGFLLQSNEPKPSFHYLKFSMKNTQEYDSGNYHMLNNDMSHGFVSLNENKEECLIVYNDEREYNKLYNKFLSYLSPAANSNYYYGSRRRRNSKYKNIEYLGTGYDIYRGNPIDPNGLDPGFRSNIFRVTKNQKHQIDMKDTLSCSLDFDVSMINSLDVLLETSKKNIKYTQSLPMAGVRPFSLAPSTISTVTKIVTESKMFVLSSSVCEIYRMNLIRYNHPLPTDTFLVSVESLNDIPWDHMTQSDKDVYFDFLDVFGTHVVTNLHMGAKYTLEYEMHNHHLEKDDYDKIRTKIRLLSLRASTTNLGAKDDSSLDSLVLKQRVKTIGARPIFERKTRYQKPRYVIRRRSEKWASKARLNPLPIYYEVVPITEYRFLEFGGTEASLIYGNHRVQNLEIAMKENIEETKQEVMDELNQYKYPSFLEECEMLNHDDDDDQQQQQNSNNNKALIYEDESKCLGTIKGEKLEWWVARQRCQMWGGDLVVIDDIFKNYFVSENFVSNNIWIGYFKIDNDDDDDDDDDDEDSEDLDDNDDDDDEKKEEKEEKERRKAMRWVNGDISDFEYFYQGQPDLKEHKQYCVKSNYRFTSSWAGDECNSRLEYVCERPYYPIDFKNKYFSNNNYIDDGNEEDKRIEDISKEEKIRVCEEELDGTFFDGARKRCYRHFTQRLDWGFSKFECMKWVPYSWGGRLAIVDSKEVSDFLKGQVIIDSRGSNNNNNKEDEEDEIIANIRKIFEEDNDDGNDNYLFRKQQLAELLTERKHVWIGLNDIAQEGRWKWEDGVYLTEFRDWAKGSYYGQKKNKPVFPSFSGSNKRKETEYSYDCVVMSKETGAWVTEICDVKTHQFVCEFKI